MAPLLVKRATTRFSRSGNAYHLLTPKPIFVQLPWDMGEELEITSGRQLARDHTDAVVARIARCRAREMAARARRGVEVIPVVARDVREISVALIDDPEIAMRETFDDDSARELLEDIQVNGVQVPLIVERRGDRFRVCAGHRRIKAARLLGAETVPCDIREPGVLDAEAIKIIENDVREKVNPAEAALYLARLFVERCHNDVDELCRLTKRSERYVQDRLVLLEGDEEIFVALRAKSITLGVALELNAILDVGYRRMNLDRAVRDGMTIAAAKQLRRDANHIMERSAAGGATSPAATLAGINPADARNVCTVCLGTDHSERMRWVPVHEHCQLAILEKLLVPWRAAQTVDVDA